MRRIAIVAAASVVMTAFVPLTASAATAIKPVTRGVIVPTTFSLRLAWTPSTDKRVDHVTIRRVWGNSTRPTKPSQGDAVTTVAATTHSYVDSAPPQGLSATYAIFARDGSSYSKPIYLTGRLRTLPRATLFQAVYVYPSNVRLVHRASAIRRDLNQVNGWYRAQTGGHSPRFARLRGSIRIYSLRLHITLAQLQRTTNGHDALDDVVAALAKSKVVVPAALAVVYVEAKSSRGECGVEGGAIAIVWMHSCGGIYPSTHDVFPYGATYLAAHEMTHAMGAVPNCAKHSTQDGHVKDSRRDLLYEGPLPRDWTHLVLDYEHDDYYRTGSTKCLDISHDHVWT